MLKTDSEIRKQITYRKSGLGYKVFYTGTKVPYYLGFVCLDDYLYWYMPLEPKIRASNRWMIAVDIYRKEFNQ
tara:strand:- start:293 stop:511 length:219 start_codon:yes stop_codon:yes gene_type:complete